ncbi:PspA/IM30 family protein [Mesobacillus jeotgali]|uniref:PspA/IM30 family protein n=1 Tax=Mesobacillus jeotgali TaxID=129985 RepID=A0ABY9VID2_9BACI|nr:PspA/IM30 family protein [Mesobacillus jeotgali]WNF23668.1 PspA/IM30 family protein [Mesobacillus jeotgali]
MANLLTRIKNTVMADLHEALDQKEKKNPIALLNQYLRECESVTEKVRKLLERQGQLKEQFAREHQQALEMAEKRKYQAEVAMRAGENELQEFAQQEQAQYEERSARLKEAMENAIKQQLELERKYEEMKHKLKDMHIRRLELMGRENVTRAHHRMDQVLDNGAYSDKSYSRFTEMETYLDQLEEKVNSTYNRNTIDSRIAQLEKEFKNKETHTIQ